MGNGKCLFSGMQIFNYQFPFSILSNQLRPRPQHLIAQVYALQRATFIDDAAFQDAIADTCVSEDDTVSELAFLDERFSAKIDAAFEH